MPSIEESKLPEDRGSHKAVTIGTLTPEEIQEWAAAWNQFERTHTSELRQATVGMDETAPRILMIAMLERQSALKTNDKANALCWAWMEIRRLGLVRDPWAKPMSDDSWLRGIGIEPLSDLIVKGLSSVRFRKGKWFRAVTEELASQGFALGGRAVPHLVQSYVRKGVYVDILGGRTLRVIKQDGRAYVQQGLSLNDAIVTVTVAGIDADCPD